MTKRTTHRARRRLRPALFRRLLIGGVVVVIIATVCTLAFGDHRISAEQVSYHAAPAGQCVPSQLNRSDVLRGTGIAVAPLPDSLDASPQTQISLLGAPRSQLREIYVSGSETGHHRGHLEAYSQGDGASFVPSKPFRSGETVTVHGKKIAHGKTVDFSFHFVVAEEDPVAHKPEGPKPPATEGEIQHFKSAPNLQPPSVTVLQDSSTSQPGDIFGAPYSGPAQTGPMIFNDSGQLVWFDPLPYNTYATNLQVQTYEGQKVLTWWQGYIPPQGFGEGEEMIANSSYHVIAHVRAGNGYEADLHDFHLMADNTAVLTVFNTIHCNLSSVGGPVGGAVTDSGFEEIDTKTGLVRRQWFPIDHVPLSDSESSVTGASVPWPYDYFHINSIDHQSDGLTLISSRNTSSLYELNTTTGQVQAKLGGKNSTVKMGEGTLTAFQHDATVLPDGDISVFDNGGSPRVHPQTRGLIEAYDAKTNTVTKVTEFEHPGTPLVANSQGDVQLMEDGNFFMGWGENSYFSEFSPEGSLLFDGYYAPNTQSYRTYRFPWTGHPTTAPSIAAEASGGGAQTTVYASWNGATEVAEWRVLSGPSATAALTPTTTVATSGFQTTITTPEAPSSYFAVQALSAAGAVLGTSRILQG